MNEELNPSIKEVKTLVEDLGKAWDANKKANDERISAMADGKSVADLEVKLANISKEMDKLSDLKDKFDEFVIKSARPNLGGGDSEAMTVEVKGFNQALRADFQSKGRPIPAEVSAEQYAQYKSGFFAMARHGNIEALTTDERKAMSTGSDPDGGYFLPESTMGRTVARIYEKSAIRRLATVQTISTNDIEGIVDNNEADAGWVSEYDARNDTNTPQVGKWAIVAHEMYAQPKVTQRLLDDAGNNIETWLASKIGDKFARVESTAFMTGNGVGKPFGLFGYATAATGDATRTWGSFEHVVTGANGAFGASKADPLQDLIGAFKDEYLQNATWVMRREVRTLLRKMKESGSDRYLWEPSMQVGQPDRLMGYAVAVDQYAPALATGSLSLGFGDVREAYTIIDRLGIRTLRDPFTAKPYVRFYSTKRTGGGAVNFEAFKFLKFSA